MWGAIKKAINSNLNKSLDVLIQEKVAETNNKVDGTDAKIGATNNTGGTASAGSIFAKLNKLLTDWNATRAGYLDNINTNVGILLNGRVVKSVQYGSFNPNPGNTVAVKTVTITHNAVNVSKSFVIINGGEGNVRDYTNMGLLSNRQTSSFDVKNRFDFLADAVISWQIVEFY